MPIKWYRQIIATRTEKIHAIISERNTRVYRTDVILSIAPSPSPFLERYKNAVGVYDRCRGKGRGGAINASNTRAHEWPEGSSRFQNARICTEQRECRAALTAIRAPRVLLSLRQLPTPLLPSRVCTRVSAIRNYAHPHVHECEQERASEQTSRGILAGHRYWSRQRIPTTSGNSVTDERNPVAPIVENRYLSWEYQTLYSKLWTDMLNWKYIYSRLNDSNVVFLILYFCTCIFSRVVYFIKKEMWKRVVGIWFSPFNCKQSNSLIQTRFFASAVKHRLFSPARNKRESKFLLQKGRLFTYASMNTLGILLQGPILRTGP